MGMGLVVRHLRGMRRPESRDVLGRPAGSHSQQRPRKEMKEGNESLYSGLARTYIARAGIYRESYDDYIFVCWAWAIV